MPTLLYADLSRTVIGAAIEVHRKLGPGFLESIYEQALCLELAARGISFERQSEFTVTYRGVSVGKHRLDLLVERKLVVELKATSRLDDVYYQVVRSYITALGESQGLLVNFGTNLLQVKRVYANRTSPTSTVSFESDLDNDGVEESESD
jgi:GxxExxY protein